MSLDTANKIADVNDKASSMVNAFSFSGFEFNKLFSENDNNISIDEFLENDYITISILLMYVYLSIFFGLLVVRRV